MTTAARNSRTLIHACMVALIAIGIDARAETVVPAKGQSQEQVQKDVLKKYGLSVDEVMNQFNFFNGWREVQDAENRR